MFCGKSSSILQPHWLSDAAALDLCEGVGVPGALEVIVEVVEPLLAPFWQSCRRLHAANLEILLGRNGAAMFA